jgi:hypothetical protein
MSHLIALVFDDQFKGEEARAFFIGWPLKVCSR